MITDRLIELKLTLPEPPPPVGLYQVCKRVDKLLYTSMLLPIKEGVLIARGKVDSEVSIPEAGDCCRQIVLNALAIAQRYLGDLNMLKACLKVSGYIASSKDFYEHPKVMNYASELIKEIFKETELPVRSVVGLYNLPLNSPVAIDFVFELH